MSDSALLYQKPLFLYFRIFANKERGGWWYQSDTGNKKVGFYHFGNTSQHPKESAGEEGVHRRICSISIKPICKNFSIMASRDQPFDMQMKILMIGDSGKFRLVYLSAHQK
jgi:hypothetical protein